MGWYVGAQVSRTWRPYTRLFLVGDEEWVIGEEMREVGMLARRIGIRTSDPRMLGGTRTQCVFYGSQFELLNGAWRPPKHRLATAYFHGKPGTPGMPEFDACYEALVRHHSDLARVQVSHSEMHEIVLESGIDPAKVFQIPIAINVTMFAPRTPTSAVEARRELGIPESAFVVGSFQKDGVGFGDGFEPKLIKGPDVLVEVAALLHQRVPDLMVLLTGPARGYVRRELEHRGVPYRHTGFQSYAEIPRAFHACDACVVTSRQEGGPKAVLEAMASAVPLVTTKVGQAMDLVRNGENAWIVEIEDVEGIVDCLELIRGGSLDVASVIASGLTTAAANSYEAQLPLWRRFFDGFLER
jgi:glycosyltransferase involved in cell wall biosynthesis